MMHISLCVDQIACLLISFQIDKKPTRGQRPLSRLNTVNERKVSDLSCDILCNLLYIISLHYKTPNKKDLYLIENYNSQKIN